MKNLRQRLLAVFQTEYREHADRIRELLSGLEARPDAAAGAELEEAFRRAHSLKGAARAVDLRTLETLAHRLESLFSRVRQGELIWNETVARTVRRVLDTTEDWSSAEAEESASDTPLPALLEIDRLLGSEAPAPTTGLEESRSEFPAPALVPALVPDVPGLEVPTPGPEPAPSALAAGPEASPPSGSAGEPVSNVGPGSGEIQARVSSARLDQLVRTAGRVAAEAQRLEGLTRGVGELDGAVVGLGREWQRVRAHSARGLRRMAEDPELAPLTEYLAWMEQQLETAAQQARGVLRQQRQSAWQLRQVSEQLEDDVRGARTVSVGTVLAGFRKMARDVARQEGKEVEVELHGTEVEADRSVLQALKDPLMHLLRNAIGHGIERPADRGAKGSVGQISVRVAAAGTRLEIEVEDDGRGIDLGEVARRSVRQGLLTADQAEAAPPETLHRLLFHPGFSTARSVSDISGRGMGLSVVQEAVQQLLGEVEILPGRRDGTCFRVRVPLTVSSQRLLLVEGAGQQWAVPAYGIERLLRVPVREIHRLDDRSVIHLAGKPVALFSLAQLLDLEDGRALDPDAQLSLLLLRSGERRVAISVDAFREVTDGLVRGLGPRLQRSPLVGGGTLLADATVVVVLNPAGVIDRAASYTGTTLLAVQPETRRPANHSILVVDDSITTRTLEKSLLEAHGYRVTVAVDGVEALQRLQGERFDLVITDVQMPHLDGYGLVAAIKTDPRFQQIPVIMVTSLERREDQERGLALGADAYVVKRRFDQADLLETIEQLLY